MGGEENLQRCHHSRTVPGRALKEASCRWEKQHVRYVIGKYFRLGNDRPRTLRIIQDGFKIYEPLTGLKFRRTHDWKKADIQITRGRGKRNSFDGPGKVLAWAELPCEVKGPRLRVMFDAAEPWNLGIRGEGVILQAVWMHELGHVLGLDHSRDGSDLMAPYYNPLMLMPQPGDRKRLAELYGLPLKNDENAQKLSTEIPATGFRAGSYSVSGSMVVRQDGTGSLDLTTRLSEAIDGPPRSKE